MNTAELKVNVINQITLLKEDYLVEEIKRLLDIELVQGVFKLSPKQKECIAEAKQEYKRVKSFLKKQPTNKLMNG